MIRGTFKHCKKCNKQISRDSILDICSECLNEAIEKTIREIKSEDKQKKCSFCSTTSCVAYGQQYFESLKKSIFVDFRADMEYNQIDCAFGTIDDETGLSDEAHFSDFAIDIKYCPVCGRKLPPVE